MSNVNGRGGKDKLLRDPETSNDWMCFAEVDMFRNTVEFVALTTWGFAKEIMGPPFRRDFQKTKRAVYFNSRLVWVDGDCIPVTGLRDVIPSANHVRINQRVVIDQEAVPADRRTA